MDRSTGDDGRRALEQRRWTAAFSLLSEADAAGELDADDLERLATAAHLLGRTDASTTAWTRAYRHHTEAGHFDRAAKAAFWLGFGLVNRGEMALAGGWFSRAQRLLDEHSLDGPERGYLMLPTAIMTFESGQPEDAHHIFSEILEVAERFRDPALLALTRLGVARCCIRLERTAEGVAGLDELMVSVAADEVPVIVVGDVYCTAILACRDLFDMRRSKEWTDALTRWCDAQPDLVPYRGQCLVHRSEISQLRGDWPGAIEEAESARVLLSDPPGQAAIGMAHYQLGELQRVSGAFDEAEGSYAAAIEHGHDPHPGLALLRLAQGRSDAAEGAIRRALDEATGPVRRAQLLPAVVDISLSTGDVAAAHAAATEMTMHAERFASHFLHALARWATGKVALAEHDPSAALRDARDAGMTWRELDAPYWGAHARIVAGLACRELGDADTAELELAAARATFGRLGAVPDAALVERLAAPARSGPLTGREIEVLRLVASGKTNRAIANDLALSEKTVARHISNIFTKLGLPSRAAATAYAYEHHLV